VNTPAVAVVVALALTGCGGTAAEPAAPAPDAARMTDLVPLTTVQAARRADRVALVVSRGSRVVEGAPGTPFTRTTFAVQRVLKGRLPQRFVVQVIGGRLGDVVVPSIVPAFASDHRYVLFLGPDGPAGPTIFPQSVIDADAAGPGLNTLLGSIRRAAR
jgi:hypothetical protein